MNKEQFIATMHKKLHMIEENERQDIINEYINHIDMKVQEGKTEEQAIEDFGDIDELVKDILDAYKINTSNEKTNYDEKFNYFLDDIFDKFKKFVSSFTSLDMDDVVKFIFELFVILILLFILKIPFEMVKSLGSSLLRDVVGFGIGSVLATIWNIIIGLAYFVVFVVVLFGVCSKRIERYRNHDSTDFMKDFKESLRFEKKPHVEHPYTEKKEEHVFHEKKHPYQKEGQHEFVNSAGTVVSLILKVFSILLFMPFIGIMIGLCVAFGILVSLSFQGVVFVGAYFILIGCIAGTSAFLSLIYRTIWKGGNM